jgi:hypothetical protein
LGKALTQVEILQKIKEQFKTLQKIIKDKKMLADEFSISYSKSENYVKAAFWRGYSLGLEQVLDELGKDLGE